MHSYPFSLGASQRLHSIRIPAKAAMQVLTTLLVFSLCLFPNLATAATPHVYDAPQAGPPGSQTQTVGNGWDPNATLDIYFDSTDVGLVDTDNNGSFGLALKAPTIRQNGLTIQIPKDAVPGQHWITAVERITQLQAQVAFTVRVDWPQFHYGPDRTGFNPYESVLGPANVGNLTLNWTFATQSQNTYATSPVVVDGVIYIPFIHADGLYALNASTGALIWKYPVGMAGYAGPAVANGIVYVSSTDGNVYALNASTGALLWKSLVSTYEPSWPTVANGVVYVLSMDTNVYALDARTGAQLWKYPTGPCWTFIAPQAVANGVVYVDACDNDYHETVYALDAGTGTLVWKFTGAQYQAIDAAPVVANGIVYVGSEDYNLYALNATTGALIWQYPTQSWIFESPAVANGVVYLTSQDSNVYALNAATGALLWEHPGLSDGGEAPVVANGVLYIESYYTPNVYALDVGTGAILWTYSGLHGLVGPAVVNGMLYIGDVDGKLYAFGLPNQQMSEKFSPPERPDPARLTPKLEPTSKKIANHF